MSTVKTDNLAPYANTNISTAFQLNSTLATGTAPIVVSSTTQCTNLNASSLQGSTLGIPNSAIPTIPTWTPTYLNLGSNTSLSASTTATAGLSFAIGTTQAFSFEYFLAVNITGGTAGLKFSFPAPPTGATGYFSVFGQTSGTTSFIEGASTTLTTQEPATALLSTSSSIGVVRVAGYMLADGTHSGNIDLQYTSGSSAAGNILKGSCVLIQRTA